MLGTLNGALEVRQVRLEGDAISAEVEGVNEVRDGLPVLTAIHIRYRLRIPAGTREVVDRALARHQEKCPTANTLRNCVAVSWSADITEA
jgi:organic hydroperoxide reductase OsmC/OhrA